MLKKNRVILTLFDELDPSWESSGDIPLRVKESSIFNFFESDAKEATANWHNRAAGTQEQALKYSM